MLTRLSRIVAVAGILVCGALLNAQPHPATGPAPAPAAPLPDLKITLMDGSLLAGKMSITELSVETKFGVLKVPVEQIRSLTPGLASHPEFQQKLAGLITDLGSDNFGDREKAQDALSKMGAEIKGELESAQKNAENEKQSRLQKLLEDIESSHPDEEPMAIWAQDDVIVTPGFTVVGHITTPGFSVTSQYGKLDLKMADIRVARRQVAEAEEIKKSITVSGNLMNTHTYDSTGIKVSKGDQIFVTATGTIQMTPWGGNQVSTPDGGARFAVMQPFGFMGGTLIGRIGDSSPPIKLGTKAMIVADKDGVFQLSIAMTTDMNGNSFPGEYQVKIRVVKK